MCYADLIEANNLLPAIGGIKNDIKFDFLAFTFAQNKVQLSMVGHCKQITQLLLSPPSG